MRRLVVSSVPGELRAALFEDDIAIELCLMREDEPSLVGGIFRGRVTRSLPALNGAFVEIGTGQPAFLPGTKLPEGATLTVRVVRDAFAEKGPEVRRHASQDSGAGGVARLDSPGSPLKQVLDRFGGQFDVAVFDRRASVAEARPLLSEDAMAFDGAPDFDAHTGLADAFDEAIAAELSLPGGGRVRFDDAAAFTAIDVDLGDGARTRRGAGDAVLAANLEAAAMIARQLRLRQIGGAVVIDFISMPRKEHRDRVEAALGMAVANDTSPVQIHGWTRLGHLELTRRRSIRPIADYLLSAGKSQKLPVATGWDVLRALDRSPFQLGGWRAIVHPGVADALSGRLRPYLDRIVSAQAGMSVEIESDPSLAADRFDIRPARPHL